MSIITTNSFLTQLKEDNQGEVANASSLGKWQPKWGKAV